jgi:ribosomal protein S18 acetylase RimI-like enzyme
MTKNAGQMETHRAEPGTMEGNPASAEKQALINSLKYSLLDTGMIEQAARAYTDVFVQDEPTTRRHNIDPGTFLVFARQYLRHCADFGLSIIAQDPQTAECVGFILCCDLATDIAALGLEMTKFLSFFPESVAIIDALEEKYLDRGMAEPGTTLHVFQLGVRREYRGRGIAPELIRRTCDLARERGFAQVIADCTSPVSHHTFERCGFQVRGSIPYDSFRNGNRKFFAGLNGGISLVIREL